MGSIMIRNFDDASKARLRLFTTSITQAEMLYGARLLAAGKKQRELQQALTLMFETDFGAHVLPFDAAAAQLYAEIIVDRRAAGQPISQFDAQIAAIARLHDAHLATRNTADFEGCELKLINPWN